MGRQQAPEASSRTGPRIRAVGGADPALAGLLDEALGRYLDVLKDAADPITERYGYSLRRGRDGMSLQPPPDGGRYDSIVVLGGLRAFPDRALLPGRTTPAEYCSRLLRTRLPDGLGDHALLLWAAADAGADEVARLASTLRSKLDCAVRPSTVELAWAVSALTAVGDTDGARAAAARLLTARCEGTGLFANRSGKLGRGLRDHVACFADQVYPVQALARCSVLTGDRSLLAAAEATASLICRLQGEAGQWWWHYDVRTGRVVEGYPVYSVHQISMAPMALFDLAEAGGEDHIGSIRRGLQWQRRPSESIDGGLLEDGAVVVWRSVRRREPIVKATRAVRGTATAIHPQLRLGLLDLLMPPTEIDHECRPYEAGWAFFAWGLPTHLAAPADADDRQIRPLSGGTGNGTTEDPHA